MQQFLFLAAVVFASVATMAEDSKYLTIAYSTVEESLTLSTVQRITFESGNVVVTTTEGQKTYPLSEMKRMTFTVDPTAVEQMAEESEGLKMQDGKLVVTGKGTLRIYNAAGALVAITGSTAEKTIISLDNLQNGLYIVNMGEQTIKIRK